MLARYRGQQMAQMAGIIRDMHRQAQEASERADALAAQLAKAGADLEAARRSPTYMDAEGREGPDHVSRTAHHARVNLERAERAEKALALELQRAGQMKAALDASAGHIERLASRIGRLEAEARRMAA